MATWESKILHHDSNMWSMKSSTPADDAAPASAAAASTGTMTEPPPLLSKSFFDAFSRNSTAHLSSSSSNNTLSDNKRTFDSHSELPSLHAAAVADDHRGGHHHVHHSGSAAGFLTGAAMEPAGLCKSETVDSHCVAVTTSKPLHGGLLNASASLGGGSTKVTKKRARASRKPPTTVLEADSANFRAMVQQLTGIPAVPFLQAPTGRGGLEFLNLVRPSARSLLGFGGSAGLSPLGSSSPYHFPLVGRPPTEPGFSSPFLKGSYVGGGGASQDHARPSNIGDFLRTPVEELGLSTPEQQPQSQGLPGKLATSCISMPLLWDGDIREGEDLRGLPIEDMSKFKLEKSEPEEADQEGSSRLAIVDSWLTHADQGTESRSADSTEDFSSLPCMSVPPG